MPALEPFGVEFVGNQDGANAAVLAERVALIAAGQLEVPIAEIIPLDEVQRAYPTLERRHTRGQRSRLVSDVDIHVLLRQVDWADLHRST